MCHLDKVDAKELGEAIDMIKDLAEAIYYCTITDAMVHTEPSPSHTDRHLNIHESSEMEMMDHKEGKSPKNRKTYIEAKETHQDKAI
jgi:phage anti-repressor protein